jgi:O-antigen/teichoic acid export membrane protein
MKFWKKFISHPLFSGSLVMVGGSMAVNIVNYFYHVFMGRILGPVNYGTLASLYSIIYLIGIVPISASVAIVKFISSAKNQTEVYSIYLALRRFVFFLALTTSLVLFVASPFIAKFLNISNFWLISLVSVILFFLIIALVNQATSQGLLKFLGSVAPSFISAVVKLTAGLTLVFLGFSVFGAMVGIVIAVICAYLYSVWFIGRVLQKRKGTVYKLKPFFIYSFPVLVQALAFTSFFTTDVILVKHFLPAFQAGIYAALSTLGKIIYFAASPITATMFPIVSSRKAAGEGYYKVFLVSFVVTVLLSAAIVVFYWLFPNIAIGVLYGKAYLSARAELVWMGAFILFYTLSYLLVNYSLSLGKVKIVMLPLFFSLIQIPAIWFFHGTILQVIQISLVLSILLFLLLTLYLGYNRLGKIYGKN